jgi:poly(3-hydroxybutyrate) depolymerase
MKLTTLLVALVLGLPSAAAAERVTKETFRSNGANRTYYLFVPDSSRAKPAPLLVL